MFFLFQRNFKSCFVSALTWIMEAGNFHTLDKQELINIIGQKSATVQTLINERKWIEEDNHLYRIQAIELKEKLLKWQIYASKKEKQLNEMQNETARLKEDDKKWRAGFFRVVETFRTWKTKYNQLNVHFTALVKKYNTIKQQLDHLITLRKYMREERDLYKYNSMALLQYIFYQLPTNAVAEIIEIEKELRSNALVPLFQNQSFTAPPDVRMLISCSGISVIVNYLGGLHCPTQPFARSSFIEIPHIRPLVLPAVRMAASSGTKKKLRKGEEVFASRSRAADHAKALVAGASSLFARPEEGRIVTSSISERDDVSAGHVSTWRSLTTADHTKAVVTGANLILARPEEGEEGRASIGSNSLHTIVAAPNDDAENSSDIDLSNSGHASNESKVKVRKDKSFIIYIYIPIFVFMY